MTKDIAPTHREICANCQHCMWMIGLGLGLRCRLTSPPAIIQHREHTCNKFESKHNPPVGDPQK